VKKSLFLVFLLLILLSNVFAGNNMGYKELTNMVLIMIVPTI